MIDKVIRNKNGRSAVWAAISTAFALASCTSPYCIELANVEQRATALEGPVFSNDQAPRPTDAPVDIHDNKIHTNNEPDWSFAHWLR